VAQFEKFVIPKRSFIARGICFGPANSRFLTGKERRFGMTKCNAVQTEPLPEGRRAGGLRDASTAQDHLWTILLRSA